jgi:hypothetical protein
MEVLIIYTLDVFCYVIVIFGMYNEYRLVSSRNIRFTVFVHSKDILYETQVAIPTL